jgi:hypothetical protein
MLITEPGFLCPQFYCEVSSSELIFTLSFSIRVFYSMQIYCSSLLDFVSVVFHIISSIFRFATDGRKNVGGFREYFGWFFSSELDHQ